MVFAALDGALGDQIRSELATKRTLCLSPLLAKRLSPSDDQREADPVRPTILAGLKFRSPGGAIAADFFKSLGADAGMVPFNGMYEALKARQFDGRTTRSAWYCH